MLRFGKISELGKGENLGFARVHFDETDIASGWLQLPSTNTKAESVKDWKPVAVNSQVACHMDDACEQGYIAMVLWSNTDTPPEWANDKNIGIEFPDGTKVFYDWSDRTLTVDAPGAELNIKCKKLNIDSDVFVTGEVTAGPTAIKLTQHTHTSYMGPTGPPIPEPSAP